MNSVVRRDLGALSGTDNTNGSILAGIELIYLPDILETIAEEPGLNELFVMLFAAVSYLESVVISSSRGTCCKQRRKKEGHSKVKRGHM